MTDQASVPSTNNNEDSGEEDTDASILAPTEGGDTNKDPSAAGTGANNAKSLRDGLSTEEERDVVLAPYQA